MLSREGGAMTPPALGKVSHGDASEATLSPRRESGDGLANANAMLSPVLSRARDRHKQEMEAAGMSESTEDASSEEVAKDLERGGPGFKTTAQVINALRHPVHVPSVKGGEGIRRLVETREKNKTILGMSIEYWDISLFSVRGRAWPMLPQLLYIIYSTIVIAAIVTSLPNYRNVKEFAALQFPISTLGVALFFLLSFRTNSSYERWWEGRKCWDSINTLVQDNARIALSWVAPKSREVASGLIRWSLVFAFVAKKTLRVENEYPELAGILSQAEIEQLQDDVDPVQLATQRLTELLFRAEQAQVSIPIFAALDGNIRQLLTFLGNATRILSTPMPFAYIVHLRSFILLWLLGLPFAFVSTLGWWSIIVCSVTGYELLGFETIGVEIENPFGRDYNDLPLDLITTELFVKLAGMLAKLGQQVDVEPLLHADPLGNPALNAKRVAYNTDTLHRAETGSLPPLELTKRGAAGAPHGDDDGTGAAGI